MSPRNRCPVVLVVAALATFANTPAQAADEPATTRVSVSTNGIQSAGGVAVFPVISAQGGFVAFASGATNLVPGDSNAAVDVFVRELGAGVTTRVSVNSSGAQGTDASDRPAISADGRFVTFDSAAEDLVSGDTNTKRDVFIHDRHTHQTTRVSVSSAGAQANGDSVAPKLSADGRIITFQSGATNLVSGDTNGASDVFVHDRLTGETTRVNVSSVGAQATGGASAQAFVSGDGRVVAFASAATNLVPGDTNALFDVFVHDRDTGATRRASVGPGGAQANNASVGPSLNADGSAVAYVSAANNLVPGDTNAAFDIFVTRGTKTVRVNIGAGGVQGNGNSNQPRISDDGLSVAFNSAATNLVPNDTNGAVDIFVSRGGRSVRMNLGPAGDEADQSSSNPSISADGRIVAFSSTATNLVDDDTNGAEDSFVSVLNSTHQGFQLFP